ncbi:MAG: YfhO family protein [Deltaproteobacteria bacterium]|nr:YfhO family protein [Deltaproteobacteria bacterium]
MSFIRRHTPAVVIVGLALVAFVRLLYRTDYAAGDDVLEVAGPFSTFFWRSIAEGDIPIWNPYQETGVSIFNYSPWMGPFYPLVVLYLLLPLPWALNAGYLFHILLAAAGCYRFGRRLGLERQGATAAAAVLLLSSEFVYRVNQGYLPDTVSVAYLPWLLFCIEGVVGAPRPSRRDAALLALCTGLLLLGGHTTHNWMVLFTAVLYSAVRILAPRDADGRGRLAAAGMLCAAFAAGLLVGAVQVFPTLQAIAWSPASGGRELRRWPEFVNEWWRLFQIPFLGAAPNLRGAGFAGVTASALAIVGAAAWRRERARLALFAAAAVSYVFFISTGVGLYGVLAEVVPTFGTLSYTYLFLFPVILVMAVCAGRGLDLFASRAPTARELGVLAMSGAVLVAWAVWYRLGYRYPDTGLPVTGAWLFVPFFVACAALVAALFARRSGALDGRRLPHALLLCLAVEMTAYVWHASEPRRAPFRGRDYFAASLFTDGMKRRAATGERFRFWDLEVHRDEARRAVKHHQSTVERLEEAGITSKLPRARYAVYSRLFGERLTLDRYVQPVLTAERGMPDAINLDEEGRGAGRLLSLLNVRFVISNLGLSGGDYLPVLTRDGTTLYENTGGPARAYVAARVFSAKNGNEALETILRPDFDARGDVVVEAGGEIPGGARGTAAITSYRNAEVRVRVSTPAAGVLVLLDPFDPNWRAEVSGRPAALMRANYLFRAVQVPPGDSEVVFRYRPIPFFAGCLVSPLAAALLLFLVLCRRARAQRFVAG